MQTYSKEQVIDLIKSALDEADNDLWQEIKGRPAERERLLAAADALESVTDALYRQLGAL